MGAAKCAARLGSARDLRYLRARDPRAGARARGRPAMRHSIARSGGPGRLLRAVLCAAALFAVACTYTPKAAPKVDYGEYLIGPPDRLIVSILPDPPVIENVVVRPDGMITVQLV